MTRGYVSHTSPMHDSECLQDPPPCEYQALAVAVIERAIRDAVFDIREVHRLVRHSGMEAREWIFSEEIHDYGFLWWCQLLSTPPEKIRISVLDAIAQREKDELKKVG